MNIPIGELAALGTAFCWTATAIFFTAAGERIGSLVVNLVRLVLAFVYLTIFCWLYRGLPFPTDATRHAWTWLSLSAVFGFLIGDLCLFRAFVVLGPRMSTLMMSLVPPIAAVLGWIWLEERLDAVDIVGMFLTLAGIVWVVLERNPTDKYARGGYSARGLLMAFLGAIGQAVGLIFSKIGLQDYDAFAAGQIRVLVGITGFSLLFFVVKWWRKLFQGLRHRTGMGFAAIGAFAGPFLGVSLSLVAIRNTQTGIAATIMAIVPVLIIPVVIVIYREKVSGRAILGAMLAVAGVAVLWLH